MFSLLLEFLQAAANRLLRADADAAGALRAVDGKTVAVRIAGDADAGRAVMVHIADAQLWCRPGQRAEADAVLTARAETFAKALRRLCGGEVCGFDEIEISGDAETGRRFIAALARLQVDWEEETARFTGDAPARAAGSTARALSRLLSQNCAAAAEDFGWFLKDEAQLAARGDEVDALADEVRQLHADVTDFSRRLRAAEERARRR
ncbi:MAG: SCP2 sterol-binding domain-containing protein [Gammaproteobacteria bacterium]|nr:SCP2 sterol-binding domain-containing protein [Gammaproteobacteria bacterium]